MGEDVLEGVEEGVVVGGPGPGFESGNVVCGARGDWRWCGC